MDFEILISKNVLQSLTKIQNLNQDCRTPQCWRRARAMAETEVTVSMEDMVVVKSAEEEDADPDNQSKTQMILQLQPITAGWPQHKHNNNASNHWSKQMQLDVIEDIYVW